MVLKQEEVLYRNGYDIGIGVAMATGSPMALGAKGEVTPPRIGTGGSGSFTFRRLDTTEELEKELGISADVSGGIGLFSASNLFSFSEKCKIHASSLFVLVSAKEQLAFQQMDSPELTAPAAALVENGKSLSDQFGEYFIRGINTGGYFFGVIQIETKSAQTKTDLDNELSGSYGLTVNAEIRLKISQAMNRLNARVEGFYTYEGGRVTTRTTSNDPIILLEQLFTAMSEWTATVRNEPKPYSVTLAPYSIALGPIPPNIADIENQRDVLIRCAKLRSLTLDKLNLIDYMLDVKHMDEFEIIPPPEGPDLSALQASLARDRDAIADAASFAINNIKQARDPEIYMREVKGVEGFKLTALPTNLPKQRTSARESAQIVVDLLSTNRKTLVVKAIETAASEILLEPPSDRYPKRTLLDNRDEFADFYFIMGGLLGLAISAIIQSCQEGTTNSLDEVISLVNANLSDYSSLEGVSSEVYIQMLQNIKTNAGFNKSAAEVAESKFQYVIRGINR